jgi:hypothetical protein
VISIDCPASQPAGESQRSLAGRTPDTRRIHTVTAISHGYDIIHCAADAYGEMAAETLIVAVQSLPRHQDAVNQPFMT